MNRIVHLAVAAAILAAFVVAPTVLFARPAASRPTDVRVSNLQTLAFTVSWTTPDVSDGEVRFGTSAALGRVAKDIRGDGYRGRTHYVVVREGLQAETLYYFDAASDGDVDDNSRQHYQVRTAPVLDSPGLPEQMVGFLREADDTMAQDAIVYATIMDADGQDSPGESTLMSALVQPQTDPAKRGFYQFLFSNAREQANLRRLFRAKVQADRIRYEAMGPGSSTGTVMGPYEIAFAQFQLTLPTPAPTNTPQPTTATPTQPATATPTPPTAAALTPTPGAGVQSPTATPAGVAAGLSPTTVAGTSPTTIATIGAESGTPTPATTGPTPPVPVAATPTSFAGQTPAVVQPTAAAGAATPSTAGAGTPATSARPGTPVAGAQATTAAARLTPTSAAAATRSSTTPVPPTTTPVPPTATATQAPPQPAAASNPFGWLPIVLFGVALTGAVGAFAYLARRMQ